MKPPCPPHHEEPRGQGRQPDYAHPDPYTNADLVTGAEGRVDSCWRSVNCRGGARGAACLLSEDPAVDMDGEHGRCGIGSRRSGIPLLIVVGSVICDGGARADDSVALGGFHPRGPGRKCVFPERVKCQPPRERIKVMPQYRKEKRDGLIILTTTYDGQQAIMVEETLSQV